MVEKAIVLGTSPGSIGEVVAALLELVPEVHLELPKRAQLDVRFPIIVDGYFRQHQDATTLVLAQGETLIAPIGLQAGDDGWYSRLYEVVETNLIGSLVAADAFVRYTRGNGQRKRIIVITSLGGSRVFTNSSTYCATKAALDHWVRCAAWELASEYDVFGVAPGNVADTNMSEEVIEGMANLGMGLAEAQVKFSAHSARERIITRTEVADVVAMLAQGRMPWASGTVIALPGGAR